MPPAVMAGTVAAGFAVAGMAAGVADWRARKRRNLDRVSLFDWRSMQVFALIGAIVTGVLAVKLWL